MHTAEGGIVQTNLVSDNFGTLHYRLAWPSAAAPKDRKAQIASIAAEAFSEQGYHAVSMDDIANRVGVSLPLYRHSPSKA